MEIRNSVQQDPADAGPAPKSRAPGDPRVRHAAHRAAHWADETADRIIREKGDKALYTCASGITPSGTVHIGNFREIISVDLVVRALRDRDKKVRFIYSWDDYDVFRKVPLNMPNREELAKYVRFPITMVPDPWGRDENYARHHEADVESVLPLAGIFPEYLYQAKRYRASAYAAGIHRALEHRDALKNILDKFRDEDHKIQGEWWPISAFCDVCNKDETDISGWDGEWSVGYRCNACGHEAAVDLREARGIKLGWRVDWPMRWEYEQVDFEPAGKDHHSQGGSFDTARHVSKDVYGREAPVTFRYDFIGIKGTPGKMSSSQGKVIDLPDVLRVYTPEVARYLFAGTRPNTEFTISFDLDVIKIYEDYDKTERIAWGDEQAKDEAVFLREKRIYELSQVSTGVGGKTVMPPVKPYQIPFRHLCSLIQIADCDIDRAVENIRKNPRGENAGPEDAQLPGLLARCRCAKYWIEECAPEEFRFRLRRPGSAAGAAAAEKSPLSEKELAGLRLLRDKVVANIADFADDKSCAEAIYACAGEAGLEGRELFRAAYQALIGKDQGPRLASFLRSIDRERLLAILADW
ncbi:MAG: lysine--tRNA ligase [Spirochaetaceae bacterium]|jgi:lysyl-tRNA synthetase class 1|nr:lysine--tRNA ligase [Spirochaetaceae bacterium]